MPAKLKYTEVKQKFEDEGCVLLEDEYYGSDLKMKYICKHGHKGEIRWDDFKQGIGCSICSKKKTLTIQEIIRYFKFYGYTLLETTYINSHTKMKYECDKGHINEITWQNFQQGHRCRKCWYKTKSDSQKHSFEYIYNYFIENNCLLLETKYTYCHSKMKYICECGEESIITFNKFKQGQRCKKCAIKKRSGKNHHKYNPNREKVKLTKFIANKCASILGSALKRINKKKINNSKLILGYNCIQLLEHLQNEPLYDKWIKDSLNYQIDHNQPVKAFVDYDILDISIINNLDNLHILPAKINQKKADSYNHEDFMLYLFEHGINYGEI